MKRRTSKPRPRSGHDKGAFPLTAEQAREVAKRKADRDAPTLTLDELDGRLRRLGV